MHPATVPSVEALLSTRRSAASRASKRCFRSFCAATPTCAGIARSDGCLRGRVQVWDDQGGGHEARAGARLPRSRLQAASVAPSLGRCALRARSASTLCSMRHARGLLHTNAARAARR
eukprot:6174574-Pleurochrysis_carterae.AAC.1